MNLTDYPKTILVSEPSRWCEDLNEVETSLAEHDTGFVNRLHYWLKAHDINSVFGNQHALLVEEALWPELKLLELANTSTIDNNKDYIVDCLKSHPLTAEHIDHAEVLNQDHWYSAYPFSVLDKSHGIRFPDINLKYPFMENAIRELINPQEFLGVHVRWGRGAANPILGDIYTDNDQIAGMVSEADMQVAQWAPNTVPEPNPAVPYMPLEYYFRFMDTDINPYSDSRRFYISSDVPVSYLKPFIDRYGDRVCTREQFMPNFQKTLDILGVEFSGVYKRTLETVVDFVCMTRCCGYLGAEDSSWRYMLSIPGLACEGWGHSLDAAVCEIRRESD